MKFRARRCVLAAVVLVVGHAPRASRDADDDIARDVFVRPNRASSARPFRARSRDEL